MFTILRASLRVGRVTTTYPEEPEAAPARSRGRPVVDPGRCDANGACAEICPSEAIAVRPSDGGATWNIDLARCVFCGLCAEACPNEAIRMSGEFELAARTRADLIRTVAVGELARTRTTVIDSGLPATMSATVIGDRFTARMRQLLRRSLHVRHMDAGSDNSTDWELNALLNPVYDLQRLGIDFVASPRHADLLLVTGAVTSGLEAALRKTYEAMPEPRIVVAAGADACGGGTVRGSYAVAGGVDRCLPVDVYIPGDPPRPQAIIWGLLMAMDRRPRGTAIVRYP